MKSVLKLGVSALLLLGTQASLASEYKEFFEEAFTDDQETFFRSAIQVAYQRLFADREVFACIFKVAKFEPVDETTIKEFHGENWLASGKLFTAQRDVFFKMVQQNQRLPSISLLWSSDADSFAYGYAHYGKVRTEHLKDIDKLTWKGTFEVKLNVAKLDVNKDIDSWAGLIGHEMLHNLMHAHPNPKDVGLETAYSRDYLINAAQDCIASKGRIAGQFALNNRCGGRE